jgi:Putative zinc-finger
MTDELERLRGSLAQLANETRRRQGGTHPRPEELVSYAAGELPTAAAEAVLEHLTVCPPCVWLVLELPAFPATPAGEPDEGPGERLRIRRPRQVILALAACLAACLIGFPLWIATHGRSRLPPPIMLVNPPELKLGETPPAGTPLPALRLDAEAAALSLYLPAHQDYPRFRVEVLDRAGKISSPAAAASLGPQTILVLFTREQLPPGDYRLRVFGVESHGQQPLADYPLRIEAR